MVPSLQQQYECFPLYLKAMSLTIVFVELYLPLQMANPTMNASAHSSTSYDSFQDSDCLNMQHFIFANLV